MSARLWSIYTMLDPRTGDIRYVGWAFDVGRRLRDHVKQAKTERSYKASWIRQLLSFGLIPTIEIVETGTDDWAEAERRWIARFRAEGVSLTNLTDGGDGMPGYKWTREQRDKLRRRVFTVEHRRKIAVAKTGVACPQDVRERLSRQRKGIPISEAKRQCLIAAHTGKPLSEEHRRKISLAHQGRAVSEETRRRQSVARKGKKKGPLPESTRCKLSAAATGRKGTPWTEEHRRKVCESKGIPYVQPEDRR